MLPNIRDGQLVGEVSHLRRDVKATQVERTLLTRSYNRQLEYFCRCEGLRFVDFTPELEDWRTGLLHGHWCHPSPADHHLHPERGGKLWARRLLAMLGTGL